MSLKSVFKRVVITLLPNSLYLEKGKNGVALTFDDGPDPTHTIPLLEELKSQNIQATFFLVGERVAKYPHIVKRIVDDGHEIGNHSMTHNKDTRKPITHFDSEIESCFHLIEKTTGRESKLFRPPYGATSASLIFYCLSKKITSVYWSVNFVGTNGLLDSLEGVNEKSETIQEGDILLMHDDYSSAREIVSILAPKLKSKGLKFLTVSEMLGVATG